MPGTKPPAAPDLAALQESLGYAFRDPALLDLALTHRSHGHETGHPTRNNERLEFLGDAILGLVVARRLYENAGARVQVGALAKHRAALVSEPALAERARRLGVGGALRLGRGEEASGGRDKDSLLADAFEAIVAAIHLDGGPEAARAFVLAQFEGSLEVRASRDVNDPKTRLQEALQAEGRPLPEYRVVEALGPDHSRSFVVEVAIAGKGVARGEGRSKKTASQEAARRALRKLRTILKRTP